MRTWIASYALSQDTKVSSNNISSSMHFIRNNWTMKQWNKYQDTQALSIIGIVHNGKHYWWQSCKPLLEHFLESNLCMLYVVSKLRKSTIQCFKRCTIQSWNERVTAIASRSLQVEGNFSTAAKSAFGCENVVLLLQKFHSHFLQCRGVLLKLLDMCDQHFEIFLL